MQATTIEIVARAKAFSRHDRIKSHRFLVDSDVTVRVWDQVAGHYTRCHSLSQTEEHRIRKRAEKLRGERIV